MSRTISEIYNEAKGYRNKYLGLTEIDNTSKMSVLNAITWVTSACIWTSENILDVFKADIALDLQNRINGTPAYYIKALLKYQKGAELKMSEDGTNFYYDADDDDKKIITHAAYNETTEPGYHDYGLVFKIATGEDGNLQQIPEEELLLIKEYMRQLSFAGTRFSIVSLKGDIFVPRIVVYQDGRYTSDELYNLIEDKLRTFITSIGFRNFLYSQHVTDAIQSIEGVVDVDADKSKGLGYYLAQWNDDGVLDTSERWIDRRIIPNSGYIRESRKTGEESSLPLWRETIQIKRENDA